MRSVVKDISLQSLISFPSSTIYRYSIRHLYGQEGSRIDRKQLECAKLIPDYDCPYRTRDANSLVRLLNNVGPSALGLGRAREVSFDVILTRTYPCRHEPVLLLAWQHALRRASGYYFGLCTKCAISGEQRTMYCADFDDSLCIIPKRSRVYCCNNILTECMQTTLCGAAR
jgi:DNA primase large subunit